MSSGKITVTNFTENTILYNITENGNRGAVVASGSLNSKESQDNMVSGYIAYQVNFFPPGEGITISSSNVPADGQLVFSVNSDSGETADQ